MKSNYSRWTVGRLIVTAIVMSLIAYGWTCVGGKHQNTLVGPETEQQMKRRYDSYNRHYFGDTLPHDTIIRYARLSDDYIAVTRKLGPKYIMTIDPEKDNCTAHLAQTLLHEMCHIKVDWTNEFDQHGPKFQGCMLDLAEHGAFNGIW